MITKNFFYKGKVIVYQRRKGYRFSIDSPMLADFLPSEPGQSALEVGTGSGIIALLALYKKKFSRIYGLEIQPGLSEIALINARENGFQVNFPVIIGDFNAVYHDFIGIRHIFSNPPFYEVNRGRLSPNPEIRDAKTEIKLSLRNLLEKAYTILGEKGNLYLVLPYSRYNEILKWSHEIGFFILRQRLIFSFSNGNPERFLIQLTNYKVSPVTLPPLTIFKAKGIYMSEMERILNG